MSNETAKPGKVFVCMACGKQSRDKYGFDPISRGWDESCMLNSQELPLDKLDITDGRVTNVRE